MNVRGTSGRFASTWVVPQDFSLVPIGGQGCLFFYAGGQSNAFEFITTYEDELHRVVVHSVLLLIGFKDKSDADAKEMRQNENHCLELLKTI